MKTDEELRAHLEAIGIYSKEEIDEQVKGALMKGSVAPAKTPTSATTPTDAERLDALALEWELELAKGGDEDEDEEPEPDGDEGGEPTVEEEAPKMDEGDSSDEASDIVAKALGRVLAKPLRSIALEVAKLGKRQAALQSRVEKVGHLAKALVTHASNDLAKGGRDGGTGQILARLDTLEKAIVGPRGDFRGMTAADFAAQPHPGDKTPEDLTKAIDSSALAAWLLGEQKTAQQRGDQNRASALYKAITRIDRTTPNDELAQYAAQFGFPQA